MLATASPLLISLDNFLFPLSKLHRSARRWVGFVIAGGLMQEDF